MTNQEITLDQIANQPFGDEHTIITDTHTIVRYDDHPNKWDKWDIYSNDQAEDSDPDPLFTSTDPQEILNTLHAN